MHVVGFTNVENIGQEGVSSPSTKTCQAVAGRVGHQGPARSCGGGYGRHHRPIDGHDIQLSIDSKVQFFAYRKLRDAVVDNKARAGSVVVLDALTGEVLALANYPSYSPNKRANLVGEQLRNRALTDTFEPGSTMKPITVAMALEAGRVSPQTLIDTARGATTSVGSRSMTHAHYGVLTVEG